MLIVKNVCKDKRPKQDYGFKAKMLTVQTYVPLYLNDFSKMFKRVKYINNYCKRISRLLYANDLVLIVELADNLQYSLGYAY